MLHHPSTSLKAPAGPASCVFKCGLSLPCCSLRAGPESRHGEKQKAEVPHLEQWYDLISASTCSNHLQPYSTHLLKRFGVYFHVFSTIPALLRQVFVCFHWHLAPWPHPQPLRSAGVTRSGHGDSTVLLQPWHQEIYQLRSNKFLETSKDRSSEWLHSHLCWVCVCLSRIHMPDIWVPIWHHWWQVLTPVRIRHHPIIKVQAHRKRLGPLLSVNGCVTRGWIQLKSFHAYWGLLSNELQDSVKESDSHLFRVPWRLESR